MGYYKILELAMEWRFLESWFLKMERLFCQFSNKKHRLKIQTVHKLFSQDIFQMA